MAARRQHGNAGTLPKTTYRAGKFKLAVWAKSSEGNREVLSLSLTKSFRRERDAPWEEQTVYLFPDDIAPVSALFAKFQAEQLVKTETPG